MLWPSVQMQIFASVVAVMETLQYGIYTTKNLCVSSRDIRMEPPALIFHLMELNCGLEDLTIQFVLGISEKGSSFSSTTFLHKYFHSAIVLVANGWLSGKLFEHPSSTFPSPFKPSIGLTHDKFSSFYSLIIQYGKFKCRGLTQHKSRQIPTSFARELCFVTQIFLLR